MGRIKLCFGVLIAIIVFGIAGILIIENKTGDVINLVEETKSYSDSGDTKKALESVDQLEQEWKEFHEIASILIRNDKISAVQEAIARLRPLIEKENDELNAEYASAKSSLEWIIESEIPRFSNIF